MTKSAKSTELSVIDIKQANEIMQKARIIFRVRSPYWWGTFCKLIPVERRGLGTFGVSKRGHFLYDPAAVLEWGGNGKENVIAGVIAHEVMHIILQCWLRVGNRNPKRWNIAQDLYINGTLRDVEWELPECGVFPEDFTHKDTGKPLEVGLTSEQYYDLLPEYKCEKGGGAEKGNGKSGPCNGECGSGAGNPFDGEPEPGELGEDGDRTPEEMRQIVEQCARDTAAAAGGKHAGTIPGDISRWAEQSLAPAKIHWHDKLSYSGRHVISKAGRGRNTYSRPHRRQACMGRGPRTPILPSRNSTQCDIWFAIDTSGSMGIETELRRAVSELKGILRNKSGSVSILACDVDVQGKPKRIKTIDEAIPMLTGGGGTDFRPIFEAALALPPKERPDLIVVATDGCGPAPEVDPGIPTIWMITANAEYAQSPAPWGEFIQVDV